MVTTHDDADSGSEPPDELLWNIKTVILKTGLSRPSIYRYMKRGQFPARRRVVPIASRGCRPRWLPGSRVAPAWTSATTGGTTTAPPSITKWLPGSPPKGLGKAMKTVSKDLQANLSLDEKPNHGIADNMPEVQSSRRLPYLKRVIRRKELRQLVPLSDTTIYEMEQRGDFPKRFYLTPRCAAWDLGEVVGWIERRRRASAARAIKPTSPPDVGRRKSRPVRR